MTNPFKVGDKVRPINSMSYLKKQSYVVIKPTVYDEELFKDHVFVIQDNGLEDGWHYTFFELAKNISDQSNNSSFYYSEKDLTLVEKIVIDEFSEDF